MKTMFNNGSKKTHLWNYFTYVNDTKRSTADFMAKSIFFSHMNLHDFYATNQKV